MVTVVYTNRLEGIEGNDLAFSQVGTDYNGLSGPLSIQEPLELEIMFLISRDADKETETCYQFHSSSTTAARRYVYIYPKELVKLNTVIQW